MCPADLAEGRAQTATKMAAQESALDRAELRLEAVHVLVPVADHLLEHRGSAVVAEIVALLGRSVERS
jgi:hypothetical protein